MSESAAPSRPPDAGSAPGTRFPGYQAPGTPRASAPAPVAPARAPVAPVAAPSMPVTAARAAPAPAATAGTAVAELPIARDAEIDACWRGALEAINRRKRMLGAFLEESRFLGVAGNGLVIAMDDLHRAVVEEKETRALLLAEAAGTFGRPLELRCVPLDQAPAAPAPEPPTTTDLEPMIHRTIAWFDGDVIDGRESPERNGG